MHDVWSNSVAERLGSRGFKMKQRCGRWKLKLCMSGLDPPISDTGMNRYCHWLRTRLAAARGHHGAESLHCCFGEIDFSNNGLSDQSACMLLEVLAQYEVQATSLKLSRNHLSRDGLLAICEFIRTNRAAGPVHELDLANNEIDDVAVYELMRTLKGQSPKYPPQPPFAANDGAAAVVPVWICLKQNKISQPAKILQALDAERITFCDASSPSVCGPGRCVMSKKECPLVHLYRFTDQACVQAGGLDAETKTRDGASTGDGGRGRGRRR
eukprot:TRINITY_DN21452_c0_g1_i3.p1 TRINITY_DN21452_c0_g1~~TRINITY_DN21452_c0_g1_i3.p1  ORF type:complete len:269 (-),score=38.85 TRINITY_DN21452_c0_g1_i3:31-837(-)